MPVGDSILPSSSPSLRAMRNASANVVTIRGDAVLPIMMLPPTMLYRCQRGDNGRSEVRNTRIGFEIADWNEDGSICRTRSRVDATVRGTRIWFAEFDTWSVCPFGFLPRRSWAGL